MSGSRDNSDPLDQILADFHREMDGATDPQAVIRSFLDRYPEHAAEFRGAESFQAFLNKTVNVPDDACPERLGDFRIVRRITHGGMGDIYEAIQEPLERRVVVKTIRRGFTSPQARERFLREQRVLAETHETHIVPVFAAGECDGMQYFAMPYLEGTSLDFIVREAWRWQTERSDTRTPELGKIAQRFIERTTADRRLGEADTQSFCQPAAGTDGAGAPLPAPSRPSGRAGEPVFLSIDYFRSVAEVLADIADSLAHVHRHGFIHRDLKPSNIMVDTTGQGWVIDFGLAGHLRDCEASLATVTVAEEEGGTALTRHVIGTPGYWAPEQEAGRPTDARTDVWGLGVTLYELITLRPAFPRRSAEDESISVQVGSPPRPRHLVRSIPLDLEAICLKALGREPDRRYETAREFGDDLRRWLRDEPTVVRPARVPRRVALWAKRNKGWASAILTTLVGFVALSVGGMMWERTRASAAEAKQTAQQREALLLEIQNFSQSLQLPEGWSLAAWEKIRQAAAIRVDAELQSQAAASLSGIDARLTKRFTSFDTYQIAYGEHGNQLLMVCGESGKSQIDHVRIWDSDPGGIPRRLPVTEDGPVDLLHNGKLLQLANRQEKGELAVVNLLENSVTARLTYPDAMDFARIAVWKASPDETRFAAAAGNDNGNDKVFLWDGTNGNLLNEFGVPVTSLQFSPDANLLVGGDSNGRIYVWSVASGQQMSLLRAGHCTIHDLAFSHRQVISIGVVVNESAKTWLLATADSGGTVTVWDLKAEIPRTYCRGSDYDTYAVAFSPDGTTIASTGRHATRLWDLATGRTMLTLKSGNFMTDLAFSPDGRKLAVGGITAFNPGQVGVWEVEPDRGIRKLHGLVAPISKVQFSPDGQLVGALSNDWQIGIWEIKSGRLRQVFDVPAGFVADNAALAFDESGRRFAFCAGTSARMWDLATGAELDAWELPQGLVDCLAFPDPDTLVLFREETKDGLLGPFGNVSVREHPRVCRIRNLLSPRPIDPLAEIADFDQYVVCAEIAPNGRYIVVDGLSSRNGRTRIMKAFDQCGKELCEFPATRTTLANRIVIDPTSSFMALHIAEDDRSPLMTMPGGKPLGIFLEPIPQALSPRATHWTCVGRPGSDGRGLSLFVSNAATPLITLGTESKVTSVVPQFDPTGRLLMWGNDQGTVVLADIHEVNRRLTEIGLGW